MAKDLKKTKPTSIPLVSVVMSAYNAEKYIKEAIDSILNQTFTDFEFIIINDGSTDGTLKIIKSYHDPRIVLISRENKGLVASLNEGIRISRGKYIARMDADDISMPERFAKQVDYLEGHPEVGLIGGQVDTVGEASEVIIPLISRPIDDKDARLLLGYGTVITHVAAMYRIAIIKKIGFYDEKEYLAEDHDLWCRMAKVTKIYNLPEILISIRTLDKGVSLSNTQKQVDTMNKISKKWRKQNTYYSWQVFNPLFNIIFIHRYRRHARILEGYSLKPFFLRFMEIVREDIMNANTNYFIKRIALLTLKVNRILVRLYG